TEQTIDGKGNYDLGALPEIKANFAASWGFKGFGAGGIVRYIGSFKECSTTDADSGDQTSSGGLCYANVMGMLTRDTGAYATLDLHASYGFSDGAGKMSIAVGANNVLDAQPKYVYSAALANSDPSVYDYLGLYLYARIKQTF